MHGYYPEYISDEYDTLEEAVDAADNWLDEGYSSVWPDAIDTLREMRTLEVSCEIFDKPEESRFPGPDTSLWYIRIEEGPFDYDNTSERI